ncbi:hypothetical protein LX87_05439 [Larkinella arboricola]|uniref:Uncharacterized protein n=1 Tax=Larkinella arboricola TaxID=643671 RepID=A0A327WLM6_LARAB|nr:hypothetical protein [Larkinella arboricola]RAJ90895.1 hypothetical protein LX87_05439 [Larkinella arboricola]
MINKTAILFTGSVLILVSCRNQQQEQQLLQREQALLEKEKQFALKEADYQALTKMRDSLIAVRDTGIQLGAWPQIPAGPWSSREICTESTCSDYAIGDQRSDTWEFSSDSTQRAAKVISNNRLVRVYTAQYANNALKLSFKTDSSASKRVEMSILLNEISPTKMKGVRTVTVDNQCNATFTVELSRISTNE